MDRNSNWPWWIGALFGLGVVVVTAFGPELLPEWGRWSVFGFGCFLIILSGFELLRHKWRTARIAVTSDRRKIVDAFFGNFPEKIREQLAQAAFNSPLPLLPPHQTNLDELDWKTPLGAIEAFGAEFVREERDRRIAIERDARLRSKDMEEAIRYFRHEERKLLSQPQIDLRYADLHAKSLTITHQYDIAKSELQNARRILRTQIINELEKGTLVARGFRSPRDGNGDVNVPKSEWRNLVLDFDTGEALSGKTLLFSDVRIAKIPEVSQNG